MNLDGMDIGQKRSRRLKIALAAIMTAAELLFICMMLFAYKEMRHEGATYSQWYEGSIAGFYGSVVWLLAVTLPFIAAWHVLIRDLRGMKTWRRIPAIERSGAVFLAFMFAFLACMFGYDKAKTALEYAQAANSEALAWNYESVGRYKVLMMLSAQGYALSLAAMIKASRAARRRGGTEKGPSGRKARRKALRKQNAAAQPENAGQKKGK